MANPNPSEPEGTLGPAGANWRDPTTWSVVVTGGSAGLGAATCRTLVSAGATVASLDRRPGGADTPSEVVTLEVDPGAAVGLGAAGRSPSPTVVGGTDGRSSQ